MYRAIRRFKADGRFYEPGEGVPAESWSTRGLRVLLNLGYVEKAPDDGAGSPGSVLVEGRPLDENWSINDLRQFAKARGLTIPAGTKKADLVDLIKAHLAAALPEGAQVQEGEELAPDENGMKTPEGEGGRGDLRRGDRR